jgi:hypothetical protein
MKIEAICSSELEDFPSKSEKVKKAIRGEVAKIASSAF